MYKLMQKKVCIFQSEKKIDAIYEHQQYKRRDGVRLVYVNNK